MIALGGEDTTRGRSRPFFTLKTNKSDGSNPKMSKSFFEKTPKITEQIEWSRSKLPRYEAMTGINSTSRSRDHYNTSQRLPHKHRSQIHPAVVNIPGPETEVKKKIPGPKRPGEMYVWKTVQVVNTQWCVSLENHVACQLEKKKSMPYLWSVLNMQFRFFFVFFYDSPWRQQ